MMKNQIITEAQIVTAHKGYEGGGELPGSVLQSDLAARIIVELQVYGKSLFIV